MKKHQLDSWHTSLVITVCAGAGMFCAAAGASFLVSTLTAAAGGATAAPPCVEERFGPT